MFKVACLVVSALFASTLSANASNPRLIPVDRPGIEVIQKGDDLVITWFGVEEHDKYQLRWGRPGKAEVQHTLPGHQKKFIIRNVHPGKVYTIKVQHGDSKFLGGHNWSPWNEIKICAR